MSLFTFTRNTYLNCHIYLHTISFGNDPLIERPFTALLCRQILTWSKLSPLSLHFKLTFHHGWHRGLKMFFFDLLCLNYNGMFCHKQCNCCQVHIWNVTDDHRPPPTEPRHYRVVKFQLGYQSFSERKKGELGTTNC